MAWKMGKDCGNIPQKVEELPKYNKLRYQVPAIFADTTKNYGSRTNGKIKKGSSQILVQSPIFYMKEQYF